MLLLVLGQSWETEAQIYLQAGLLTVSQPANGSSGIPSPRAWLGTPFLLLLYVGLSLTAEYDFRKTACLKSEITLSPIWMWKDAEGISAQIEALWSEFAMVENEWSEQALSLMPPSVKLETILLGEVGLKQRST